MFDETAAAAAFDLALANTNGLAGDLIPLLQAAQEGYGYVPEFCMERISDRLEVGLAEVFGVVTFYKQFRLTPRGRYLVRVCDGTACHVNDSKGLIDTIEEVLEVKPGETDEHLDFTVETVACIGCCSLAPVIVINDDTHGRLTPRVLRSLLKKTKRCAKAERLEQTQGDDTQRPSSEVTP
jgi:NADH-quinone oxidoreductase subunit E